MSKKFAQLNFRTMFLTQHVVFAVGQETQAVGNSSAGFVSMFPSPSFWSHLLLFLNVAPATKHLPQFLLQNPPHLSQKKIGQSETLSRLPVNGQIKVTSGTVSISKKKSYFPNFFMMKTSKAKSGKALLRTFF